MHMYMYKNKYLYLYNVLYNIYFIKADSSLNFVCVHVDLSKAKPSSWNNQ